jgi:type IV pilus assembly protein PilO
MASARELRRTMAIVLAIFVVIDLAAIGMLFSPLADRQKRQDEYSNVRRRYEEKIHAALPLQNIDKKLSEAQQQIDGFYRNRLPQRDSEVADEVGKLAQRAGVRFSGVRYSGDESPLPNIRKLQLDVSLAGDYLKIVKFINQLERDKMFFIVDRVTLNEQQGGGVRLELRLETYLRQA